MEYQLYVTFYHMARNKVQNLSQFLLVYYSFTGVIEGIIALWLLLSIPTDPKNFWLFGYSTSRLAMIVFLVLAAGAFLILTIKSLRSSKFQGQANANLEKLLDIYDLTFPILITAAIPSVIRPYIKMLTYTPLEVIPERISPFIFLVTTRTAQAALVTLILTIKRYLSGIHWKYSARKISIIFTSIAILLVMASIFNEFIRYITQHREVWGLKSYFELSYEHNVPTYFAALLSVIAGIILAAIAIKISLRGSYIWHWIILSLGFLYLAVDEVVIIHERIGQLVVKVIRPEDLLFSDWAYAGIVLILILIFIYLPFYKHLPSKTKKGFFISAFMFVGAALGLEIIGSAILFRVGYNQAIHTAFTTVEEFLEMFAIIIFIETLSNYLMGYHQTPSSPI
ncbi:MAG: hypothetical protein H8D34_08000 [Chloroflexi bacterium]|nr:hypothetical protein [Chloroflexota bacterium]